MRENHIISPGYLTLGWEKNILYSRSARYSESTSTVHTVAVDVEKTKANNRIFCTYSWILTLEASISLLLIQHIVVCHV